jgi:hypothetical protein
MDVSAAHRPGRPAVRRKTDLLDAIDTETLLERAEAVAAKEWDGHLTIMRFTTGWKAVMGTPDIWNDDRGRIRRIPTASTMAEALRTLLRHESDHGDDDPWWPEPSPW